MKKVLVAVAVVAFFASCKKDYSCTCPTILGGVNTTISVDYNDLKKSDADDQKAVCETGNICTWAEK